MVIIAFKYPNLVWGKGVMPIRPHDNEYELLAKVAEGNQYAFTEIFNHYYQPLGQAMLKITESLPLAQEIIQDAFINIWLRRGTLVNIDNFSGYLFILCRNQAFATLKKLAKERKLQPVLEQELQWETELDDLDNPAEHYRELIQKSVEKLPLQQQKIYNLSRHERLKYEEIGNLLGISPETVKTQIYNAVKFIRKDLNSHMAPSLIVVLTTMLSVN